MAESPTLAPMFTFKGETLALIIIGYGFVASVLPVWLLLAPRDYLSTFLKIGTIAAARDRHHLRRGPSCKMPAVTKFIDGTGPVFVRQRCSRSCSSPSPAARSPASTR